MKRTLFFNLMGIGLLWCLLPSCQENLADRPHYATPDWLKGSAYEVLQKEGHYKSFLRGVELSGYAPIVQGKSILTVMAPNDSVFDVFLQKHGYATIDEMFQRNPKQLKKTIGFHLLYYAFNWDNLVNFRPQEGDEASDEQRRVNAGLYHKFRTKSGDPISKEWNGEDSVQVYHFERFVPVFSTELFATKGIDPTYNYEYFFPTTKWTGSRQLPEKAGFNVSNAAVLDNEAIITDNGYLYRIDHVLEPLETIYTELKNNENYSTFFRLFDSYGQYEESTELTTDFGKGQSIYLHKHPSLKDIAVEWPVSNYSAMSRLSLEDYNLFVPSNKAIDQFFEDYWTSGCGYGNLAELDPLIMQYFIGQTFSKENMVVFPEEIKAGNVQTQFGTPINIDPDKVNWRKMCCNGALYGMDDMNPPAIFTSVIGSAFRDRRYLPYLYALDGSGLVLSLASQNSNFIALIPDTAQFKGSFIRFESIAGGRHELQVLSDEGDYVPMSNGAQLSMVNMNVAASDQPLKTSGLQVIETNTAFNYWYVVDGKITTSALFNKQLNPTYIDEIYFPFQALEQDADQPNGGRWDNGYAYTYASKSVFEPSKGDNLNKTLALCNDKTYPYYLFSQLLNKAGLVKDQSLTLVMQDARFICFVPTNDAIKARIKEIPGCEKCSVSDSYVLSGTPNKSQLANYLRSLFITSDLTPFSTYPYPGSGMQGGFETSGIYKLNIYDLGNTLQVSVTDNEGNEGNKVSLHHIDKFHSLPFSFSDGAFHLIEDILL